MPAPHARPEASTRPQDVWQLAHGCARRRRRPQQRHARARVWRLDAAAPAPGPHARAVECAVGVACRRRERHAGLEREERAALGERAGRVGGAARRHRLDSWTAVPRKKSSSRLLSSSQQRQPFTASRSARVHFESCRGGECAARKRGAPPPALRLQCLQLTVPYIGKQPCA